MIRRLNIDVQEVEVASAFDADEPRDETVVPRGCGMARNSAADHSAEAPVEEKPKEAFSIKEALGSDEWRDRVRACGRIVQEDATEHAPQLLKLLSDPSATVRINAAVALGRLGHVQAVPKLLPLLKDKSFAAGYRVVAYGAVRALAQLGDKAAIPALIEELETPYRREYYLLAVFEALFALEAQEAAMPMRTFLWTVSSELDPRFYVVASALRSDEADREMESRLADQEAKGHGQAVRLAAYAQTPKARKTLEAIATGEDWQRAKLAAASLARYPDKGARAIAVGLLLAIDKAEHRSRIITSLEAAHPEFHADVVEALAGDNPYAKVRAAKVLAESPSPVAFDALVASLESMDVDLVRQSIHALEALGDDRAASPLRGLLEHADSEVPYLVARALGTLGDDQAVPELKQMLRSPDRHLRRRAALALGKIGGEEAVVALIASVSPEQSDEERSASIAALCATGAYRALPTLLQAHVDGPAFVRVHIEEALAKMESPEALPLLRTAILERHEGMFLASECLALQGAQGAGEALTFLKAAHPHIRAAGAKVFHILQDRRSIAALEPLMEDVAPIVRLAAGFALWRQGATPPLELLQRLIGDKDPGVRWLSRDLFGELAYPLHAAVSIADAETLESLLDRRGRLSLDQADDAGDTPLHVAARLGKTSMARLLYERGANPRIVNAAGTSPVEAARQSKHPAVAKVLLENP